MQAIIRALAALAAIAFAAGAVAQAQAPAGTAATATTQRFAGSDAEYDKMIKLASNENNWGPPESVMKAMNGAFKYANRYGYPDGNVVEEIAAHMKPDLEPRWRLAALLHDASEYVIGDMISRCDRDLAALAPTSLEGVIDCAKSADASGAVRP